jgi:hypothetical protein
MDSNLNTEESLPVLISIRTLDAFANLCPAGFSTKETVGFADTPYNTCVLGKLNTPVCPTT